jgi:hypothetical protein
LHQAAGLRGLEIYAEISIFQPDESTLQDRVQWSTLQNQSTSLIRETLPPVAMNHPLFAAFQGDAQHP